MSELVGWCSLWLAQPSLEPRTACPPSQRSHGAASLPSPPRGAAWATDWALDCVHVLGFSFNLLPVPSRGRNFYLYTSLHTHQHYHSLPPHIPLLNWLTPAGDFVKIHKKTIWTWFSFHPWQITESTFSAAEDGQAFFWSIKYFLTPFQLPNA